MWQQVAEGTMADLRDVSAYEGRIDEGRRGRLQLNCRMPVSADVGASLQRALDMQNVAEVKVDTSGSTLSVTYRKGFAWLPIIVTAILGLIFLAILISSWVLFKEMVGAGIPPWLIASAGVFALLIIAYIVYKVRW